MPSEFSTKVKEGMKTYREGTDKSKLKQAEAKKTALSGAVAGLATDPNARQQKKIDRNANRVKNLTTSPSSGSGGGGPDSSPANPASGDLSSSSSDSGHNNKSVDRKKLLGPPVKERAANKYGATKEDRVRARRAKSGIPMADWMQRPGRPGPPPGGVGRRLDSEKAHKDTSRF